MVYSLTREQESTIHTESYTGMQRDVYLIKDIARLSGMSIYTVKYYLKLGLVKEIARSPETNFRYFDDSTLKRLAEIRKLRRDRVSLRKIKELLNGTGAGVV